MCWPRVPVLRECRLRGGPPRVTSAPAVVELHGIMTVVIDRILLSQEDILDDLNERTDHTGKSCQHWLTVRVLLPLATASQLLPCIPSSRATARTLCPLLDLPATAVRSS
jgi:hypothetical protein